jgi:hypothetical protein
MNSTLRTAALLVLVAACSDDSDGDHGAGGSLAALEEEFAAKLEIVCARANECFQPDAQADDDDWCNIPTSSHSGTSFHAVRASEPCLDKIRQEHADAYRSVLECDLEAMDTAQDALHGDCPATVSALDGDSACETNTRAAEEELEDALGACEG